MVRSAQNAGISTQQIITQPSAYTTAASKKSEIPVSFTRPTFGMAVCPDAAREMITESFDDSQIEISEESESCTGVMNTKKVSSLKSVWSKLTKRSR